MFGCDVQVVKMSMQPGGIMHKYHLEQLRVFGHLDLLVSAAERWEGREGRVYASIQLVVLSTYQS
jgi:hypothetical protein